MMTDAQQAALVADVVRALEERGVEREGAELKFRCFRPERHEHCDVHWSAYFNPEKAVWLCRVCSEHGGLLDLADRLGVPLPQREDVLPPRLEDFAQARYLTLETLSQFSVRAVVEFGRPALRYPTAVRIDRLKFLDGQKPKYRWARKGGRRHWYGLHEALTLLAASGSRLYLVNGEPSVWACRDAHVPAICLAGGERATPTRALVEELAASLAPVGRSVEVAVVYDTDAAGKNGAPEVLTTLKAAMVNVVALDLAAAIPDVVGADVDDLHRQVGDGLAAALDSLPKLVITSDEAGPESRSHKGTGTGKEADAGLVRVWETPEPPPRVHVVGPLIPQGATTILYGDGGQGKSYVALHLASCVVAGHACLGYSVERSPVLYVDAELDQEEFSRRAYRVARGLGLDRPPDGLYYFRLSESLTRETVRTRVAALIRSTGAGLVVLDSLTIAAYGGDLTAGADTTALLKAIEPWGTVLAIDHPPAPQHGVRATSARPYGSTFKYNLARSVVQMIRAPGGAFVLHHKKQNFEALLAPVGIAITFGAAVTLETIPLEDERLGGLDDDLAPLDRVDRALRTHADGAAPNQLAEELDLAEKTVRNHLTTLRAQGRAAPFGGGRWRSCRTGEGGFPNPDPFKEREPGTVDWEDVA
jgi:hypothetical protein